MKTRCSILLVLVGLLSVGAPHHSRAATLGTAFSYQGRLLEQGLPAAGNYDLQFALFGVESGGSPTSVFVTNSAVVVASGIFQVSLDFGIGVFTGANLWLEIGVRRTGTPEGFITLNPRQLLKAAPYSVYTLKAESLVGPLPDSQLSTNVARLDANQAFRGAVTFQGPVAIGGSNGLASLDVQGNLRATTLSGDGAGLSNVVATYLSSAQRERLGRVSLPFVAVTNAGNAPDSNGKGAVSNNFRIGKYEVNNNQYAEFLNAVAADDPHALYSTNMAISVHGGITRSGSPGEYTYAVKPGHGHRPAVWVDFYDALRFCNWLHNGQPSGPQDKSSTEDGAYSLTPAVLAAENALRNPGARFWLPSDDEWYKAAYHQPAEAGGNPGNYWLYPTQSDDVPFGELPPGDLNAANSCCETGRMSTDVGAYVSSPSFYGTFDQAGNVQEWTEWTDDFTVFRNRRLRGGSWAYNEFYARSTDFEFDTTDYDGEAIGFRVAGSP